ncbi:hypothetical protein LTR53_013716 [Teratosphaeriaceae sp. CCFEE 6253]|nr:hypothetical protein LTR53_013716 [Teratosphaeriaceae sp. CCFEE 6253]
MICAYGPYSASATGGNGWSRDFLAGVLTLPATPFFENIGHASGKNLEYACTILACIAFVLVMAVYAIYFYGPTLRARSPFAQQLQGARMGGEDANLERRVSHASIEGPYGRRASQSATRRASLAARPGPGQRSYSQQLRTFGESRVTPRGTPKGTPHASRANSLIGNKAQ